MTNSHAVHSPEVDARRQMTNLLEAAIAKLPERFRVVFVLREVEGLSVEETAEALHITRETVKTLEAPQRPAGHLYFRGERLRCSHAARACNVYSEWAISVFLNLSNFLQASALPSSTAKLWGEQRW